MADLTGDHAEIPPPAGDLIDGHGVRDALTLMLTGLPVPADQARIRAALFTLNTLLRLTCAANGVHQMEAPSELDHAHVALAGQWMRGETLTCTCLGCMGHIAGAVAAVLAKAFRTVHGDQWTEQLDVLAQALAPGLLAF